RLAARLGHHGCRMMPAKIEKCAECAVTSAYHDKWLTRNLAADVVAGFLDLLSAPGNLPRAREDCLSLTLRDLRIRVPGSGNRPGLCQRQTGIVSHRTGVAVFRLGFKTRVCTTVLGDHTPHAAIARFRVSAGRGFPEPLVPWR